MTLRANHPFPLSSSSTPSYFSITILGSTATPSTSPSSPTRTRQRSSSASTTSSTSSSDSAPRGRRRVQPSVSSRAASSRLPSTSIAPSLVESAPPCVAIGVCGEFANLRRALPGREPGSFGYHSDDGYFYDGSGSMGELLGGQFLRRNEANGRGDGRKGTTVGCAVCWETDTISFWVDDVMVGKFLPNLAF